ncbi:hypothetical protein GC177_03850 [bacterium]|nr:hypothetical protein [bacterium]
MAGMSIQGDNAMGLGQSAKRNKETLDQAMDFASRMEELIAKTNAPILQKKAWQEKQGEIMKQRMLEVGIERFIQEQVEVKKLMKVMKLVRDTAPKDEKEILDKVIDHFEKEPAKNVDEIYSYIAEYVAAIPSNTNHIKERMEALLLTMRDMMGMDDKELSERLKDAEKPRIQATSLL